MIFMFGAEAACGELLELDQPGGKIHRGMRCHAVIDGLRVTGARLNIV